MNERTLDLFGVIIPDAGPVFLATLAGHVLAGLACVAMGFVAAMARKGPGRHPWAGRAYLWSLTALFATSTVLSAIRWRQDAHLFAIDVVALGLGFFGWRSRRERRAGWVRWHAFGMGGSYIALLTGFYVDNGPQLPVWRSLPHATYWLLPAVVGIPIVWRAARRHGRLVS